MDAHYIGAAAPGFNTPANPVLDSFASTGGISAGLSNPTNDDAPSWQAEGIKKQREAINLNCDGARSTDQACTDKRFKTLRARLALAGYALSRADASDGAVIYRASRWGMARMLDSLVDVESFAVRVGVTA